jgi:hypothetical protein
MASNDFISDINDFNNIKVLVCDIFVCVFANNQHKLISLIMKENIDMVDLIEKTNVVPTDAKKLRFYTSFMILLWRAKYQSIKMNNAKQVINTTIAGENISMSLGKWIKYFIDPAIDKFDQRIKSFKLMKEMADDFNIAKIKLAIEKYLNSGKQSIDILKIRIGQIILPEKCPCSRKLINIILELCDLSDYIGPNLFDLSLENILYKF